MNINTINTYVDYTNLKTDATETDIKQLVSEAIKNKCASVCIQPCYVEYVRDLCKNDLKICTVIGFPNGYSTTAIKMFEIKQAIENGADEVDVVINICDVKNQKYSKIRREIMALTEIAHENNTLIKIIIETCKLTDEEIEKMTDIVFESGADFIKTSTGFSDKGCEERTLKIICDKVKNYKGLLAIKASGGIREKETAEKYINMGCSRIGCSKVF